MDPPNCNKNVALGRRVTVAVPMWYYTTRDQRRFKIQVSRLLDVETR